MTELDRLEEFLKNTGVSYSREDKTGDGYEIHQIVVYEGGKRSWDAVCHPGSYGYNDGLLEIMGRRVVGNSRDVVGYLTARDVIDRLAGRGRVRN